MEALPRATRRSDCIAEVIDISSHRWCTGSCMSAARRDGAEIRADMMGLRVRRRYTRR